MTQSTEQERAEFEAAYVAEKLRILDSEGSADGEKAIRAVMLRRNASGDYDNSLEAHFSWWAWQASAARRAPVVQMPNDVAALVAAAQALVLDPTSHVKKLQLEAHAWGPLAAAPRQPACNPSMQPELATKPPEAETDDLGIPKSCGKPLCSPSKHHPLCDLAAPVQLPEPVAVMYHNSVQYSGPAWHGEVPDGTKLYTEQQVLQLLKDQAHGKQT